MFSFGHKNADVASNLKYFTSDGLILLNEKEDKVYPLRENGVQIQRKTLGQSIKRTFKYQT